MRGLACVAADDVREECHAIAATEGDRLVHPRVGALDAGPTATTAANVDASLRDSQATVAAAIVAAWRERRRSDRPRGRRAFAAPRFGSATIGRGVRSTRDKGEHEEEEREAWCASTKRGKRERTGQGG